MFEKNVRTARTLGHALARARHESAPPLDGRRIGRSHSSLGGASLFWLSRCRHLGGQSRETQITALVHPMDVAGKQLGAPLWLRSGWGEACSFAAAAAVQLSSGSRTLCTPHPNFDWRWGLTLTAPTPSLTPDDEAGELEGLRGRLVKRKEHATEEEGS